ncbi:MAG: site-2 protease family protein [Candidatus Hydrogenedentota bacterium]
MLFSVFVFIVVLGVLIFFHEMGHFLAAKACNIYVERFSLGMPPRLLGVQLGETDYCVGALPIGGYVKMAGQEDRPLTEEERQELYRDIPAERWFNNKPVWQRMIVIVAGPLMNIVLGVLLYGIVAGVGSKVPETEVTARVGFVKPESPAASAPLYKLSDSDYEVASRGVADAIGWETGDRIVSIDGEAMRSFSDITFAAILGAGDVSNVVIERPQNGETVKYLSRIEPKHIDGSKHTQFGIQPFRTALIDRILPGLPAAKAGLKPGDVIRRANGQIVDNATFTKLLEDMTGDETVHLNVERDGQMRAITLQPTTIGRFEGVIFTPSLYNEEEKAKQQPPTVGYVSEEVTEATGLKRGDVVLEVNGEPATAENLREAERENIGQTINLKVKQQARLFGLARPEKIKTVELTPQPSGAIGIVWGEKMVFHQVPPIRIVPEAFRQGYKALSNTIETLVMLFAGTVSPKDLGGPVLIYQVTTTAASMGIMWLLKITAFISVNLCVFNLLPLPVLDGGHLIFLAWEGIWRKPIPEKTQERIQQVGLVVIISLLLFVTYNDILRLITSSL